MINQLRRRAACSAPSPCSPRCRACPASRAQSAAEHVAHGRPGARGDERRRPPCSTTRRPSRPTRSRTRRSGRRRARRWTSASSTRTSKERDRLYTMAELYARRAVEANPGDAEGHFHLARALGRKALSLGKRDQVKYAGDVRSQALEALKLEPEASRRAARDGDVELQHHEAERHGALHGEDLPRRQACSTRPTGTTRSGTWRSRSRPSRTGSCTTSTSRACTPRAATASARARSTTQ